MYGAILNFPFYGNLGKKSLGIVSKFRLTGFYMRATLAFNGLSELTFASPEIIRKPVVF